ncbi:hypothetical protein L7F22_024459 [Adiantum nelumboides]|nr:hypothetical protein [Adiantum nelumboides]
MSMPPIGPTYTFTTIPSTTLGSDPRPPVYAAPIPRPTPGLGSVPPTTTPLYRTPPGFPPRPPIYRGYMPHHAMAGIPYYPPPPTITPPADPIAVAVAVGRAMAEQLASCARDANRTDSRRSVDIAKLITKFSGDRDPRQHLEIFEQVCEDLNERNDVTKSHAFSLTLSDKAGKRYRTLKLEEKQNMAVVKTSFIKAFAKQGPKWGLSSQLHSAERNKGESMRDFIYRLKHLNSRCSPHERFRDDQLLDRFINGMNHTELYNSLITSGITTWDDMVTAVIQLEDSLEMKETAGTPSESPSTNTSDTNSSNIEQIVTSSLQRYGYEGNNYRFRSSYQYPPRATAPLALPAPPATTQSTAIVPVRATRPYMPTRPYRPYTPYPPPVLPPQPKITPVNQELVEEEVELEYAPTKEDEEYNVYPEYYVHDPEGPKPIFQVSALGRGQSMNNPGRRPPLLCYGCGKPHKYADCPDRKPILCFECGEPHKVADCLYKASTSAAPINPNMPRATCSGCGIDHLIPQCPHKPPEAPVITPLNILSRHVSSEKPKGISTLNALTQLQAKADPIIASKEAIDGKSATSSKKKHKKKITKKSKKKIIGTTTDPVTIQDASDDSDAPSSSKSNAKHPGIDEKPLVIGPTMRSKVNKPGVYPAPDEEIHKLKNAIDLVQLTQATLEPPSTPILNAWELPTTIYGPQKIQMALQFRA